MSKSKEKIGFQIFTRRHYLPLIMEGIDSEIDSLQAEISRNSPPITISKDQTKFELFILFSKVSGYGLSQMKGLDERFYGQFSQWEADFLSNNFAHVELNPKLLVDIDGGVLSTVFNDHWLYMHNKTKQYTECEQLYQQDKCRKEDFPFMISGIFFAGFCPIDNINSSLAIAIGKLHKGGLIYLHQKLAVLANKYQIVPDKLLEYTMDDQNRVADLNSFCVQICKSLNSLHNISHDNSSYETISLIFAKLKTIRQDDFDTYHWPLLSDNEANRHVLEIKTLMNELFDSEIRLLQLLQESRAIADKQEISNFDVRTLHQGNDNMKSVANKKKKQLNQMEKLMLKLAKQYHISQC